MYKESVDRKFRLARIWSNRELKKFSHLFGGSIINVSAGDNIDKEGNTYDKYFINSSSFYTSNYAPGSFRGFYGRKNELLIDLEQNTPDELWNKFDVVFNHTTLEHVFSVFKAFENICKLSKDIVIIVVPFAQVHHDSKDGFLDYWRFTPSCIRRLFTDNGFEVLYESHNKDFNSAVYLFFIASKNPEKWIESFPQNSVNENAGEWIGEKENRKLPPFIKSLFSNLKKQLNFR